MKNCKKIQVIAFIFLCVLFCSTCTYRSNDPKICFTENVLPIFVANCAGCHGNMSNYEGIMKYIVKNHPQQSTIYKRIRGANPSMPPPSHNKLSDQQVYYIKTWISMGAANSSNCIVCDTSRYKFGADIQSIMNNWCVNCHNFSSAGGGFNLTDYNGVVSSIANGKLMGSIKHSAGYFAMPKNGGQLSSCQIIKIQNWINAGNPNN